MQWHCNGHHLVMHRVCQPLSWQKFGMHSKSAVLFEAMTPEETLHLLQDRGLKTFKRFVIEPYFCNSDMPNIFTRDIKRSLNNGAGFVLIYAIMAYKFYEYINLYYKTTHKQDNNQLPKTSTDVFCREEVLLSEI